MLPKLQLTKTSILMHYYMLHN